VSPISLLIRANNIFDSMSGEFVARNNGKVGIPSRGLIFPNIRIDDVEWELFS